MLGCPPFPHSPLHPLSGLPCSVASRTSSGRRAWQWRDSGVGRGVRMPGQGGCRPHPQSSYGFYLYFLGRAHVRRTRMRPYGYYQWGQGRVSFRETRASSPPPVRLPLTPRSRYTNFISIYTCTLPMAHVSHHLHASWISLSIAESIFKINRASVRYLELRFSESQNCREEPTR